MDTCELCEREVESISKHHLIPKQKGGTFGPIANLCAACHSTLHNTYTNQELALLYNSVEKLKEAEALQKYLKWIRKQSKERIKNSPRKRK